jgi:hypothetical protein
MQPTDLSIDNLNYTGARKVGLFAYLPRRQSAMIAPCQATADGGQWHAMSGGESCRIP